MSADDDIGGIFADPPGDTGGDDELGPQRTGDFQGAYDSDTNTFHIAIPPSLQALAAEANRILFMVRQPLVFVVAVLLGVRVTDFNIGLFYQRQGPLWEDVLVPLTQKGPVAVLLDDFLYRTILRPIGLELFGAGVLVVDTALAAFVFLANIPLGLAGLTAQGLFAAASAIVFPVRVFNLALVEPVTALGVGAQPAATALGAVQITGAVWLLWIVVRSIDVPLIQPVDAILAFTRPFRNFFGGLFGR